MSNPEQDHNASENVQHASEAPCLIPLHHYEEQRSQWLQERDQLQAGLMMYRYKYEELDRQVKLLPAPMEIIPSKLTELEHKEHALQDSQEAIRNLEAELQKERSLNWWQRLWRR